MDPLDGLGGVAHVLQDLRVGAGVLQRLPLELDGGQGPVDLGQLLLVTFLPLQGLEGTWEHQERVRSRSDQDRLRVRPDQGRIRPDQGRIRPGPGPDQTRTGSVQTRIRLDRDLVKFTGDLSKILKPSAAGLTEVDIN